MSTLSITVIGYRCNAPHEGSDFEITYTDDPHTAADFIAKLEEGEEEDLAGDTPAEAKDAATYRYVVLVEGRPQELWPVFDPASNEAITLFQKVSSLSVECLIARREREKTRLARMGEGPLITGGGSRA